MSNATDWERAYEDPFGQPLPDDGDANVLQSSNSSADHSITQSNTSNTSNTSTSSSSDFYLSQPALTQSEPCSNRQSNDRAGVYSDASDNDSDDNYSQVIPQSISRPVSQLVKKPFHATPVGSQNRHVISQSTNGRSRYSQNSQFSQSKKHVDQSPSQSAYRSNRSSPSPHLASHSRANRPSCESSESYSVHVDGGTSAVDGKQARRKLPVENGYHPDSVNTSPSLEPPIVSKSSNLFTSGSGRSVEISKQTEEHARRFLAQSIEDSQIDAHDLQTPLRPRQAGSFVAPRPLSSKSSNNAAQKRQLKPPSENYARAAAMFSDLDPCESSAVDDSESLGGFATANKKPIPVSAQSRALAAKAFESDGHVLPDDSRYGGGFAKANKKSIPVSAQSRALAAKALESDGHEMPYFPDDAGLDGGFATANKKPIPVSAQSRALAARALESDGHSVSDFPDDAGSCGGFATANKKPVTISAQNRALAARALESGGHQFQPSGLGDTGGGFATASGRKVAVSAENQARARKLIEELENDSAPAIAVAPSPQLFEPLSDIAARKKTRAFSDHNPVTPRQPNTANAPSFGGFSTGGGKAVTVSAAAQARAAKLLGDAFFDEQALGQQTDHLDHLNGIASARKPSVSAGTENNSAAFRPPAPIRSSAKPQLQDISNFDHMQPPTKRRKLTFNSPRPIVKTKQFLAAPNSKAATPKKQVLTAAQVAVVALSKLPQPPLIDPSAETTKFSMSKHEVEMLSTEDLEQLGMHSEIIHMTSVSALDFTFVAGEDARYGVDAMLASLIQSGCDARYINLDWVTNHWRWVVWKLACMERRHPHELLGKCLTYTAVYRQLKHRYQREFEDVKRSAVRLIVERDETPSRYMVLTVASVKEDWASVDTEKHPFMSHLSAGAGACDIELTDGWYGIACKLDVGLKRALSQHKLNVGKKLRVFNARLEGESGDAEPPLEVRGSHLSLSINGTRHAPNTMKLGFQRTTGFSVSFRSLQPGGGCSPVIYGFVSKIYPNAYMETLPDQSKIHRNEAGEHRAHKRWEDECERAVEQFAAQTESRGSYEERSLFSATPSASAAPSMSEDGLPPGMPEQRTVTPIMRIRLREWIPSTCLVDCLGLVESGSDCQLTIWRPSEADMEAIREGALLSVFAASVQEPYGLKRDLQLTASRSAPLIPLGHVLESAVTEPLSMVDLDTLSMWQEFDMSMIAVAVTPSGDSLLVTCFDETSVRMLLMHVKNDERQCNISLAQMKMPCVLTARNLEFQGYQSTYGFYEARTSILTAFIIGVKSAPPRIKPRARALESWMNLASGRVLANLQAERVQRMESGMGADDTLDAKIAAAISHMIADT